jgi:hypothetical protein
MHHANAREFVAVVTPNCIMTMADVTLIQNYFIVCIEGHDIICSWPIWMKRFAVYLLNITSNLVASQSVS